jgi:uridine phosphorylase
MTEEWQKLHVLNYEMESSTLLTMRAAFGLRGGCIIGVVNNRSTDEDISAEHLRLSEDHAIETAIQAIKLLTHATP